MPIRAFVVVLPMLIFLLTGCGAPPTAEADAARQSMASASSAGADKYAAASLKEAQTAQAALDAVRQWEYQPSLLNGLPTAVVMTVTVKFTRPQG